MNQLERWIAGLHPAIRKSLKPVNDRDFLHISYNPNIKSFVPRVPHRSMKGEDDKTPRICGSESIAGCILGHSAVLSLGKGGNTFDGKEWEGDNRPIMTIYRLNVDYSVLPTKKVLPDRVDTKELWAVPYKPEYWDIKPETVGRIIVSEVTERHTLGKRGRSFTTFYLQNYVPIKIGPDGIKQPGCWTFDMEGDLYPGSTELGVINLFEVTQAEFNEVYNRLKTIYKK